MQSKTFKPKSPAVTPTRAERASEYFKRHLDPNSALGKVFNDAPEDARSEAVEAAYELIKLATGEYEHDKRHDADEPEAEQAADADPVAENARLRAELENEKLRAELAELKAKAKAAPPAA